MIQRIEQWRDGELIDVQEIEIPDLGAQPLDRIGVIATLNAVLGVWTLTDAANAAGVTPQQLIDEAEGWAAAG